MGTALVWIVRLCALVGWIAAAVACTWLLGATAMARPWHEPFVWGAVAVGCAVVRAVALWVLRDGPDDDAFASDVWVRLRTGAVWLLVSFSSAAFFVALLTSPDAGEKLDALREAGAEISTATVVERQSTRGESDEEGGVKGYVSRLVISVPGGAERLVVRGAYTYDKPGKGTQVDVLWARSAPGLGGYVNESKDLPALAELRWKAFQHVELAAESLIAFIVIVLFGAALGTVSTLVPEAEDLQERAWSAPFQTVRAASAAAVFWGWTPHLLGHAPSVPQMLCVLGSVVLVLVVYVSTSVRSLT
ncbi:hypothetical protein [Streptomyces regalis]|uniref:DUF3592 domain-containing protein n=1 Tax=Streptomyces regalis TaxID=68262 RepID=A0A101J5I4_9ACTN|nr:hypothetical protein [Streptomyces regalis]KUL20614.1 hypothetical protein ADL12_48450 [Streptomyces regalis]